LDAVRDRWRPGALPDAVGQRDDLHVWARVRLRFASAAASTGFTAASTHDGAVAVTCNGGGLAHAYTYHGSSFYHADTHDGSFSNAGLCAVAGG
jgi:hypothetical protein